MKLFGFFKKEKQKEHMPKAKVDENGYICKGCGVFNPMSFKYCPYCGTKQFSDSVIPSAPAKNSAFQDDEPTIPMEDETTRYLRKMNLLHLADQQFGVTVQLENGKRVVVSLPGRQRSDDVLKILHDKGVISYQKTYRFTNWPSANPCIGPAYHLISACVCELNPKNIYYLRSIGMEGMRMLYGCPNSKSVTEHNVLDHVKVEIIDYEN